MDMEANGKITVVVIPAVKDMREVVIDLVEINAGVGQLEKMQQIVGGWIEAIDLVISPDKKQSMTMWINEDGKGLGLPVNPIATVIALECQAIPADDLIRGDVLITGTDHKTGNTISVQHDPFLRLMDIVMAQSAIVISTMINEKKRKADARAAVNN